MMTKEESTKIVKVYLITPRGMGLYAGAWSYSEHAIFQLLFLSTLGHGSDKLRIKKELPRKGLPRL